MQENRLMVEDITEKIEIPRNFESNIEFQENPRNPDFYHPRLMHKPAYVADNINGFNHKRVDTGGFHAPPGARHSHGPDD